MARMESKYPGTCNICGRRFSAGADIDYVKGEGGSHWICKSSQPAAEPIPPGTKTYNIGGGSGYGCQGWTVGQVVRSSKREQEERQYPQYLYVLKAGQRYVREDGLSFGVGDDSGHLYHATCREATPEEAAPLIARLHKQEVIKQAKVRLDQLKREIQEKGIWPKPPAEEHQFNLKGEVKFDTANIYGGGDWFIIQPEHVWYVRNNGSDGGDWSMNNVRTGGAGGIGWRVPATDTILQALKALEALLGTTVQDEAREREMMAMIEMDRYIVEG